MNALLPFGLPEAAAAPDPFDAASLLALRPPGGFSFIMADPPWRWEARSEKGHAHSPQAHYACTSLEAITALPIEALAARDCVLWLWGTNAMWPAQLAVIAAWGFRYSTAGTWGKVDDVGRIQIGTGYWLRNSDEPYAIALRGRPRICDRGIRSLILAPRREHSRKPDQAYANAERMVPEGHRLDLFSRASRPGWTAWGHEAGKLDEVAA